VDYSVVRQGNSKQLLYKILDEVAEHLLPITRAYRTKLRLFQELLQVSHVSVFAGVERADLNSTDHIISITPDFNDSLISP
jgi:Mg2+ and Co2+ transporter CorA